MKYFVEIKDNKKFINILKSIEKDIISLEVFLSFVRLSYYNSGDEEEFYMDLDRKYFNIIDIAEIKKFSVIKIDLLNIFNKFDLSNKWVIFQDDTDKIIVSDSSKGFFIL